MNDELLKKYTIWSKDTFAKDMVNGVEPTTGWVKGLWGVHHDKREAALTYLPLGLFVLHGEYSISSLKLLAHHLTPFFDYPPVMKYMEKKEDIKKVLQEFKEKYHRGHPKPFAYYIGVNVERMERAEILIKVVGVKDRKEAEKLALEEAEKHVFDFHPDSLEMEEDVWEIEGISNQKYDDAYSPNYEVCR